MASPATELLAPGLLEGTSILVVSARPDAAGIGSEDVENGSGEIRLAAKVDSEESVGAMVGAACERLGSRVSTYAHDGEVDEAAMDGVVGAVTEQGGLDMLVFDGAGLLARGGLRACLDVAWDATRAVVNHAFLEDESSSALRRIVYLTPAPSAAEHADAARAGLENLARTLSIEWARHQITLVAIALGDDTTAGEAAALTAYLASPAGAYFSGCQLDLRGIR